MDSNHCNLFWVMCWCACIPQLYLFFYTFIGSIPHQASRAPSRYWWRETWKSKSCHYLYSWRSTANNRHESGSLPSLLIDDTLWSDLPCFLRLYSVVPLPLSFTRIITLKKLSKWGMYWRNSWSVDVAIGSQQY